MNWERSVVSNYCVQHTAKAGPVNMVVYETPWGFDVAVYPTWQGPHVLTYNPPTLDAAKEYAAGKARQMMEGWLNELEEA